MCLMILAYSDRGAEMMFARGTLLAWFFCVSSWAAMAEGTVRFDDGAGFAVEGRVLSFDGEFYSIETEAGALTLAARGLICTGADCPAAPRLAYRMSVSDVSLRRLAVSMLRDYARQRGHGVSEAYSPDGILAVALTDRETGGEIRFEFTRSGGDFQLLRGPSNNARATALGFDALVPAVAAENTVTGLTLLALRAAFAGEFADWTGLGGTADVVTVYRSRGFDSDLADRFALRPAANAVSPKGTMTVAAALSQDPGGLALLPLSEIGGAVPLVVTGSCGRGALAVGDAIRTGDYPLSEVITLSPPAGRAPPLVRDFLAWLIGQEARDAVQRAGFVDLRVGAISSGFDGRQEADPVALSLGGSLSNPLETPSLDGARRLNVAMRFQDGSSQPDRLARMQIARLVKAIQSGQLEGQSVIFVGFSDADGAANTNKRLSERRAEAIRNEVVAALAGGGGVADFKALGMGEAMPVACNGVDWGERLNRRVEVWTSAP
ncbi:MAG: phosphate ABC transporter substrate-binding/OmpA family protein [Pseudomonadota bacterium]